LPSYFAISCVYGWNVFALVKRGVKWFSQFSLSFCLLEFWFCERRFWSVMHFLSYSQWEYKSTFHFLAKLLSLSLHSNCVFTCSLIRCPHCCERHGHGWKRFLLDWWVILLLLMWLLWDSITGSIASLLITLHNNQGNQCLTK
jgi:hypothetical protein